MLHSAGSKPDPWNRQSSTDRLRDLIDSGVSVKEVAAAYGLTVKKVAHAYTDHDRLRKPRKIKEHKIDHTVVSEVVYEMNRDHIARCYHCIWQSKRYGTRSDAQEALDLHNLREHS